MSNSLWVEKYRPDTLDGYVGNQHILDKVKIYIENEDVPHLLLYGVAGTGKTTLAKIITNQIDCDLCISTLLMKTLLMQFVIRFVDSHHQWDSENGK